MDAWLKVQGTAAGSGAARPNFHGSGALAVPDAPQDCRSARHLPSGIEAPPRLHLVAHGRFLARSRRRSRPRFRKSAQQ
eukprot:9704773-Alexandrium_andersonii.AAC.1